MKLYIQLLVVFFVCSTSFAQEVKKEYWDNGKLKISIEFENGKAGGAYKEYYKTGKLQVTGMYKNGKREGVFKNYYSNEQVHQITIYVNDVKSGECKGYYDSGELGFVGEYKNDKQEGDWRYYSKSFQNFTEYIKYYENGEEKLFYENEKEKEKVKIGYINVSKIYEDWKEFSDYYRDFKKMVTAYNLEDSLRNLKKSKLTDVKFEALLDKVKSTQEKLNSYTEIIQNTISAIAEDNKYNAILDISAGDQPQLVFIQEGYRDWDSRNKEGSRTTSMHKDGNDVHRIVYTSGAGIIEKNEDLENMRTKIVAELDAYKQEMEQEFKVRVSVLKDDASKELLYKSYTSKIELKNEALLKPLFNKVRAAILLKAKQKIYDLVLLGDTESGYQAYYIKEGILTNKSFDITNIVLNKLKT